MYDKRADTYTKQQAGAAIENMLLKITDLGLASTWTGAFSEITIRNALKIPDNINIEAILPIGYPTKKHKTKSNPKPPLEERVFFEQVLEGFDPNNITARQVSNYMAPPMVFERAGLTVHRPIPYGSLSTVVVAIVYTLPFTRSICFTSGPGGRPPT
mgnify:CR=1 FL=1